MLENIFPLAKVFFAKGKLLGAGRHPTGPNEKNKGIFDWGLSPSLNIPSSNICEIRLYFKFIVTNRFSGKNPGA